VVALAAPGPATITEPAITALTDKLKSTISAVTPARWTVVVLAVLGHAAITESAITALTDRLRSTGSAVTSVR